MVSSEKERIDTLIASRGLSESRERARALILAGRVFVGDRRVDKPGTLVARNADVKIRGGLPYVGRGGIKLAGALDAFGLEVRGAVVLDAGASTGGFSDCLLQRGAERIYAVDVGYGQLDWKIRSDPRVVVMDRVNIRHLRPEDLPEKPDLVTLDLSFISLRTVLPAALALMAPEGRIVALVKPQFEVGKGRVGKGGIVRDESLRKSAVEAVIEKARSLSLDHRGTAESSIRGERGNREFFILLESG